MDILKEQYELVRSSRKVLLDYCHSFNPGAITKGLKEFGDGSIRSLLVHVANTYLFWIGKYSMKKQIIFFEPERIRTVSEVTRLYLLVDEHVNNFIEFFKDNIMSLIPGKDHARNFELDTTPLQVFTHVTTHEFHHKGQIMTMSRLLGYTPPDADIIRFN